MELSETSSEGFDQWKGQMTVSTGRRVKTVGKEWVTNLPELWEVGSSDEREVTLTRESRSCG